MQIEGCAVALEEAVLNGDVTCQDAVQFFSRSIIGAALKFHGGNIAATARCLGVKRTSLSLMVQRRMRLESIVRNHKFQRQRRVRPTDVICPDCLCVMRYSCSMCSVIQANLEPHNA